MGSGPPARGDGATRHWVAVVAASRTDGVQGIKSPTRRPPSWPVAQRGRGAEAACLVCSGTVCCRISALHWLQRTILACDWTVRNASITLFSCVSSC